MWRELIPLTDPATAPWVSDFDAGRTFDDAWARLEAASGASHEELLEIARWFHHSLRILSRAPWVWIGLAEVATKLSYVGGDDYAPEGLDFALSLVERALAVDPSSVDARALKAETLMLAGRFKDGAAAMAGLPTDHWRVAVATGHLCAVTRNPITRRTAWRSAAAGAPPRRQAAMLERLATEMFDVGRVDEAIAAMSQSIALRPDRPWGHHNLANMLTRLGRTEEALASVRRALALGRFQAALNLEARLVNDPPAAKKPPAMVKLCAACGTPLSGGPCGACRAEGVVELTEIEVSDFRRVPCRACQKERIGFAKRCPHCLAEQG